MRRDVLSAPPLRQPKHDLWREGIRTAHPHVRTRHQHTGTAVPPWERRHPCRPQLPGRGVTFPTRHVRCSATTTCSAKGCGPQWDEVRTAPPRRHPAPAKCTAVPGRAVYPSFWRQRTGSAVPGGGADSASVLAAPRRGRSAPVLLSQATRTCSDATVLLGNVAAPLERLGPARCRRSQVSKALLSRHRSRRTLVPGALEY
jgi:hypothetical protein